MKRRFTACSYGLGLLCLAGACGRKGPPLPPLVRLPAAIGDLTAKRLGDEVVLQFTVPLANSDNSRPADLEHIEVYAHTGPLPAPADFVRYGTLVGTVPVKAVPPPDAPESKEPAPGVAQGSRAGIAETLTAAHLEPGKVPPVRGPVRAPARPPAASDLETEGTVNAPVPVMRYYVAVGISRRNRRGAFSAPLAVPLVTPPEPVIDVRASYTEDAVTMSWTPPPPSEDIFAPPAAYNVYQISDGPGVTAAERPATFVAAPPVNEAVLVAPAFKDARMQFGVERCYLVRTVRRMGAVSVESTPSVPTCLTPVDTFPPAAPRALAAVASENGVSLIWEPNTEKDLAGYLVLRGDASDETLTPLTPAPIHETTYRDTTVQAGVSYVYAVVAVDNAPSPNTSEYSNRVTEMVR